MGLVEKSEPAEPTETTVPTEQPTEQPSETPSEAPSETPSDEPTEEPTEPKGKSVDVIGDYDGKVKVYCDSADNVVTFTIVSVDGEISEYSDIKLFISGYNSLYGPLENIAIGANSIKDNKLIITAIVPNSSIYKMMLWDENLAPLINVIEK